MPSIKAMNRIRSRSTLEEMLESINYEEGIPPDMPPALPQRPTSKARLPSTARVREAVAMAVNATRLPENNDKQDAHIKKHSHQKDGDSCGDSLHCSCTINGTKLSPNHTENGSAEGKAPSLSDLMEPSLSFSNMVPCDPALISYGSTDEAASFSFCCRQSVPDSSEDLENLFMGKGAIKESSTPEHISDKVKLSDSCTEYAEACRLTSKGKETVTMEHDCPGGKNHDRRPDGLHYDYLKLKTLDPSQLETHDEEKKNLKPLEDNLDDAGSIGSDANTPKCENGISDKGRLNEIDDIDLETHLQHSTGENGHIRLQDLISQKSPSTDLKVLSEKIKSEEAEATMEENAQVDNIASTSSESKDEQTKSKRWKDAFSSLKKNSRVWCLNSDNTWTLGIVQSVSKEDSIVSTMEEQAKSHSHLLQLPSSKLLPANPIILEGVDDLIQLSYLNEPAVLHNLHFRYKEDKIYTKAGPVLIAVNPFKKVPLYTTDLIERFKGKKGENLSPHVYVTAESAFAAMMRDGVNQSIIISGESGAGKTETAKIAMQYLAAVGGGGGVENEILKTNPILEAFGNARTLRNDNSSRFGKLIDIFFEDCGKICGAKIQTYLLEKSRVVQQAEGERSYHIFYQLCAGADKELRETINLRPANDFRYLNQSSCLHIENVDDSLKFQETIDAMDVVQISKEDQESAFAMLASILWLGNITFRVIDNDNHVTVDDNEAVSCAASLLKCSKEHLMEALCTRKMRAGHENIVQKLTASQAADSRDALAKAIYAGLFDWLVDCINKSLEVGKRHSGRSISILDIYGFESFVKNSFEQLCINYANERLQQYFNQHLFKLEQEEYISEGIDWTEVEFIDNQECLELIEKRPLGLISLLDEESTFPKGTDYTLAEKLKEHLTFNGCFKGERSRGFRIRHYAGEVTYDTIGFLEKNRDLLHSDLLHLLSSCEMHLPQHFACNVEQTLLKLTGPVRRSGIESQKQSVATKFKGQLASLMQRLEDTEPHFIRCIKPNTLQQPNLYQEDLVLQQLRCCGVLEVVRIARSGYPTRIAHQNFAQRYHFLLPLSLANQEDPLSICVAILHQFKVRPDMYQVGYTKLFFRAGQVGRLEDIRLQTLNGIVLFQKIYRGYKVRQYFRKLKRTAIMLQSLIRARKVRRKFEELIRKHRAAIQIQKYVRCRAKKQEYLKQKEKTILIQSVIRGWLARRKVLAIQRKLEEEERVALEAKLHGEQLIKAAQMNKRLLEEFDTSEVDNPAHMDEELANPGVSSMHVDGQAEAVKVSPSYLAELQSRVLVAEAALREKEEDNSVLRQRLNHYELKWSEYESKMSSMEEMWQKQMSSLQISLASAKKTLAPDDFANQGFKYDESFPYKSIVTKQRGSRHMLPQEEEEFDWDDTTSVGTKTPDHLSTPRKPFLDLSSGRGELDAGRSVVSHLFKEFEHRKQVFDDDASFLVEVKTGQTEASLNPDEELRKLKQRFDTWKKDFRGRLRETKSILQKLGNPDSAQRLKKNWWSKKA